MVNFALAILLLHSTVMCAGHIFIGTTPDTLFTCHCSGHEACVSGRGVDSGQCSSGCDNQTAPWAPWSGPGCQVGNVAYMKHAVQNLTVNATHYPPGKAVDGYRSRIAHHHHCSLARKPSSMIGPYWRVDLESNHVVQTIEITTVYLKKEKRNDVNIYVSDSTDYLPSDECSNKGGFEVITTSCSNKIGRYVTVAGTVDNEELWLTEVNVQGYEYHQCDHLYNNDYWFGPACLYNCHCDQQCDIITGVCGGECKTGYQGNDCQTPCDHGKWGANCQSTCNCVCNTETGSCNREQCYHGWEGIDCMTPCKEGTWGSGNTDGCPNRCNCADRNEVCNRTNGGCSQSGCDQWYTGTGCDIALPRLENSIASTQNVTTSDGHSTYITVGVSIGSLFLGMLIGFFASYFICKCKSSKEPLPQSPPRALPSSLNESSVTGWHNTGVEESDIPQVYYWTSGSAAADVKRKHFVNEVTENKAAQPVRSAEESRMAEMDGMSSSISDSAYSNADGTYDTLDTSDVHVDPRTYKGLQQ